MSEPITVAALYVDARGPYPKMPGVDCWDVTRDAREYVGPHPIVAHPPCGPWGKLKHLYRGAEHDCAPRGVSQLFAFGGVLEHPANSTLWEAAELARPDTNDWTDYHGFCVEVDQCQWRWYRVREWWQFQRFARHVVAGLRHTASATGPMGHVARKRTWLYLVGVPPAGIKVCSAEQRRRTPPLFADYLVRLARAVRA